MYYTHHVSDHMRAFENITRCSIDNMLTFNSILPCNLVIAMKRERDVCCRGNRLIAAQRVILSEALCLAILVHPTPDCNLHNTDRHHVLLFPI